MRPARAVADRGTRRSSPLLVVNVSVLATVSTFPARSTAPPLKVHELGATEASVDREHDKVGEPVSRPRLGTDGRHDPVDLILGQEPGELGRDASEPDTVGRHDVRKPLILRPTEEDLEGRVYVCLVTSRAAVESGQRSTSAAVTRPTGVSGRRKPTRRWTTFSYAERVRVTLCAFASRKARPASPRRSGRTTAGRRRGGRRTTGRTG